MIIESERLLLIPLRAQQLKLWLEDVPALEKEMDCTYRAEPMVGIFLNIVKGQYDITQKDETNFLYHSFWFIVRKADRIVVGSACFKGLPNENNEVEIGYGLGKEYEHQGYMTEAVQAMCVWALKQKTISHVIAETDLDGFASQQVLERCGFKQYKQDKTLWWRL